MRLGIDLDGCAYPFVKNFLAFARESGVEVPEGFTPTHWFFYEDLGLNQDQFLTIIEEGVAQKKMFINKPLVRDEGIVHEDEVMDLPEAGFINVMRHLKGMGHQIHIVTHRNVKGAARQTLEWLELYGIPTDAVHFVRDKSMVRVDLMIEDSPDNYFDLVDSGIPCVIFDQPYNRQLDSATRVGDWYEYYKLVQKIEAEELEWFLNRFVDPKTIRDLEGAS